MASTVSVMAASRFREGSEGLTVLPDPWIAQGPLVVTTRTGKYLTIAAELNPKMGAISATIDRAGGILILGRHALAVSRGAVSRPTKFTMTRDHGAPLRIRLTAGRFGGNDVGAAGFDAPVTLSLSFHRVSGSPRDSSDVAIVHFTPDGFVEELSTEVRVIGKVATAELPHFSQFGLAWP